MRLISFLLLTVCCLLINYAYAEDNPLKFISEKRKELIEKEKTLKTEEERLKIIESDINKKIERYENILSQIENILNEMKDAKDERVKRIVKTYESMPAEEASVRLSALDEQTAVKIIIKMKSKKAGAIMALMSPEKVVSITNGMTGNKKNFPSK